MGLVKLIHVSCALLSLGGFLARGVLMLRDSALLQQRWLRIAPHVVDTVLLGSAIVLASQWGLAALQLPWLQAKIGALLLYILLGSLAIRPGHSKTVRTGAWLAGLVVFGYILGVAVSKHPLIID